MPVLVVSGPKDWAQGGTGLLLNPGNCVVSTRGRHSSHSALTLLNSSYQTSSAPLEMGLLRKCWRKGWIIQEMLDCSLAAQLTPGRQVAGDGHTLYQMVLLSAEHCGSISSSAFILLFISTVQKSAKPASNR